MLACALQRTGLAQPIQAPTGTAVIVGTVLDERHMPVTRAQVQAFRPTFRSSGKNRTREKTTDETGTFRISGLPAGNYVVAAEAINQAGAGGEGGLGV